MVRDFFGRVIKHNPLTGRKIPDKEIKREVLSENRRMGKTGEDLVRIKYATQGYDVERSPHGKDFVVRRRSVLTGKVIETKHVEVKTGKAKLSKLQQKTKREKKGNYHVERVNRGFW